MWPVCKQGLMVHERAGTPVKAAGECASPHEVSECSDFRLAERSSRRVASQDVPTTLLLQLVLRREASGGDADGHVEHIRCDARVLPIDERREVSVAREQRIVQEAIAVDEARRQRTLRVERAESREARQQEGDEGVRCMRFERLLHLLMRERQRV